MSTTEDKKTIATLEKQLLEANKKIAYLVGRLGCADKPRDEMIHIYQMGVDAQVVIDQYEG